MGFPGGKDECLKTYGAGHEAKKRMDKRKGGAVWKAGVCERSRKAECKRLLVVLAVGGGVTFPEQDVSIRSKSCSCGGGNKKMH